MKKIAICLIMTIFVLSSCDLEEQIFDKYTSQTLYTNEAGLRAGVIAGYSYFRHLSYLKLNGLYLPILGHDLSFVNAGADFFAANLKTQLTSSYSGVTNPWTYAYHVIDQANIVLYYGSDVIMDEERKQEYLGQAYFLRAFSYLDLIRRYGGVPLKTEVTIDDTNLHTPRASEADVFAQIISDFQAASAKLPLASQQLSEDFGLATKGSADALLALTYLNMGEYNKAIEKADEVINSGEYELLKWSDLWDISKEKNAYKEVIFGIQFQRDQTASLAMSMGSEFGSRFLPATWKGERGFGHWRIQRWFYDYATTGIYEGDYRGETMFITKWENKNNGKTVKAYPNSDAVAAEHSPYLGKFQDPGETVDGRNKGKDFFFIRLAEVYMIKAEALNELNGPTQQAINAFNKIRERARLADGTQRESPRDLTLADVTTKDDFRLVLVNEKAVEFAGEGIRWYDLRRIKRDDGRTMYEYILTEWLKESYLDVDLKYAYKQDRLLYRSQDLLMPIPINEIQSNTAINNENQNPGW